MLALVVALAGHAQSGTHSPYSQFGLGTLADQSQGFSRGMNGVGLSLRQGNIINTLNPASYSAIDSLTMIFDAGLSGQLTNFKEGGTSVNAKGANFEYVTGSFRLMPNVGVSFGVLPYSNIGYDYSTSNFLDTTNGTIYETYSGSGGLHQAFVGAGWRVLKPLSVGINMAYVWGTYERSVVSSSSSSYINSLAKTYSASVNSYNLEVGLQWQQPLGKKDRLTLGLTMGLGHKLGADTQCEIQNVNSVTSTRDTTTFVVKDGLQLPMTYGVGLGLQHANKLFVGADLTIQRWGSLDYPDYDATTKQYTLHSGMLKDRYKMAVGADFVPGALSRNFFNRVHYRAGVGYTTPYYKINGQDGPKEVSVSAGFGIPLQNSWNNRSVLNISARWSHLSAKDMITENTFMVNIGLTFNERWFAKWKVD
jgi:hypothetical protein